MKRISLITKIVAVFMTILLVVQIIPSSLINVSAETLLGEAEIESYSNSVSQVEEEPIILGEDIELRDSSNIKHFMMSDGTTKAIIYNEDVHYMDDEGLWQDIDNTLYTSDSDKSNGDELLEYDGYETQKNKFKVKFAKNSNQKKLVSVKTEDYSMSFSLVADSNKGKSVFSSSMEQEKKKKTDDETILQNVSQKVSYKDILSDTDFEYIISGTSLKENIIVKSQQSDYVYKFDVDVKNLELSLSEDGCIYAIDAETKETVFVMPKPFMFDNNGNLSTSVNYTLDAKNKKKYQITITADKEWINNFERAFPITIDPGIQTEQSNTAMDSVYVASGYPNTSRWSDPMIMIGRDSSGTGKCQGLLKFTLPSLNRGDVVIDATLSALQIKADAYSSTTPDTALEVHAVTSSWSKTSVTWNTKPTFESETTDFEILKASEAGTTQIQRNWNVTSIVKRWYEDSSFPNYGFLLRSSNESASALNDSCIYAWLYGEKYSQSTAGYPVLTIIYRSNKGIESYWSYTTLSAGRAGTAYICDFSGNLVFTHADAATAGNRAPVTVSHIFNNYMANESFGAVMPYRGHGWMVNYQQQLLPSSEFGLSTSAQAKYPYVYIDGDGTEHYFLKKSDGTMIDEDGMGLTLTIPKSTLDFYYKVADDNGNEIWFNTAGSFAKSLDNNGNQIANYYTSIDDAKLTFVGDGAGRYISISPTSDNLAIGSVTDAAGRTTNFNWTSGKLTSITYSDGETTTFTYDSNGAMTSVKAPDGYELQFTYTSLASGKRVSKVVEKGSGTTGQTITFDYSKHGKTVMRSSGKDGIYGNSDDIFTTTSFDSAGRTVSSEATSNGKSLGATSAEYTASNANSSASNIKQLNRLSKSATGGTYVRNYLREGSADRGGYWTNLQWSGNATFDGWVTSTEQLYGRWSYYINSKTLDSDDTAARAYQTLTSGQFTPGKTYTFSAWVKTKGITPLSSKNYGAELMATYWNPDGTTKDFHSESIIGTTDTSINNGWQRISVTFSVPSNATQIRCNLMLRDCTGIAYFDGMQLEIGTSANPFNMLNNSSFEKYTQNEDTGAYWPEDWGGYLTGIGDSVDNAHARDSGHAFRFKSVATTPKEISQAINLGGKTAENLDDTYIVSGWVYANPVGGSNENNKISLCAKVIYSDGTYCHNWFNFNSSVKGWQYIMGAFTLRDKANPTEEKTPSSVKIHLINYRQSNMSWFDDIQLVRDEAPSYTYDSKGNLITVQANAEQNSAMEYSNNDLTKYVDAKGYQYSYAYDSNHNMTQATSQNGTTKYCYQYDSYGNPTSLSIKGNGTISIETNASYTANGAYVSSTTDQSGLSEYYTYNDAKGTLTSFTDKAGHILNYTYDVNTDAITSVSQTLSSGESIQKNYSYEDYRLKNITHNGFNYSFAYDSFGNVTQTKVGSQVLVTNTYGSYNGDLNRITYGNGDFIDYTYDDYGNVVAVSQNGIQNFTWNYDSTGNLYAHNDHVNNQKYLYTYDSTGRLVRQSVVNSSNNKNIYDAEYGYDMNNNVNRFISLAGGSSLKESFIYSSDNRPTYYFYPDGTATTYSYDSLLRRNSASTNTTTPIVHDTVYYMSGRCVNDGDNYRTTLIALDKINGYNYQYYYDLNGNITSITRQNTNNNETSATTIQQFAYDELNQLIRANDLEKNCTEVYNYDNGGNITSVVTYPLTWGSLNGVASTKTINYTYGDTNWKDKLTSYNGQTITYDEIGNPLSYRGYTLTWQNGRQLASLSGNGVTASYTYDVDGLRTSKTVNGVKHEYYYVGSRLQYESFGSSKLWFFYDVDGNPSGVRYYNGSSTVDYYFVCNWRGDVLKIFDSAGSFVANYDYDAWGNIVSITNSNGANITSSTHIANINPIRYRGYYYDTETKFYYVNTRYYDPDVKRMLNADDSALVAVSLETLTDKNYYAYCDNNPVLRTDGEGDIWHVAAAAAIGGISNSINEIIDVAYAYSSGDKDLIKMSWVNLGISFLSGAISGGLTMTTIGIAGARVANGFISGIAETAKLGVSGEDFSLKSVAKVSLAVVEGVVGSSAGVGNKSYNTLAKQTLSRCGNAGKKGIKSDTLISGLQYFKGEVTNALAYYSKSTAKFKQHFIDFARESFSKSTFIKAAVDRVANWLGW